MPNRQEIILYTTFGCHLCEQVEAMISALNEKKSLMKTHEVIAFDIIDDEKVLEEYRTTIPVLENQTTKQKLFWPFTYDELEDWISRS